MKELTDAKARHARVLAANLQVAMVDVRVALVRRRGRVRSGCWITSIGRRGALAVTQLVECERLTLGLATEILEVGDRMATETEPT